jgi:DNA polymerase III subunit delta
MVQLITSPSFALLQTALKATLATIDPNISVEYVDGSSVAIPEWLPQALGASLWAEHKVTVITQAYFFAKTTGKQPLTKTQDDTMLIKTLEQQTIDAHLIFVYQGEIDERLSLVKLIKKNHQWKDLPIPKKDAWSTFISSWSKQFAITLTPRAFTTLITLTYPDIDRSYQELKKLSAYGNQIDEATILSLIRPNLEDNVFELTNHLMSDKLALALKTFQDLMLIQTEPTLLISLLGKHFQLFAKVRYRLDKQLDTLTISKELNIHEFRIRLMAQAAKRFPSTRINQILLSLETLDEQIKKGRQDKVEGLSWWIVNFPTLIS